MNYTKISTITEPNMTMKSASQLKFYSKFDTDLWEDKCSSGTLSKVNESLESLKIYIEILKKIGKYGKYVTAYSSDTYSNEFIDLDLNLIDLKSFKTNITGYNTSFSSTVPLYANYETDWDSFSHIWDQNNEGKFHDDFSEEDKNFIETCFFSDDIDMLNYADFLKKQDTDYGMDDMTENPESEWNYIKMNVGMDIHQLEVFDTISDGLIEKLNEYKNRLKQLQKTLKLFEHSGAKLFTSNILLSNTDMYYNDIISEQEFPVLTHFYRMRTGPTKYGIWLTDKGPVTDMEILEKLSTFTEVPEQRSSISQLPRGVANNGLTIISEDESSNIDIQTNGERRLYETQAIELSDPIIIWTLIST